MCAEPFIYRWSLPDETEETTAAVDDTEGGADSKEKEEDKEESEVEKGNGQEDV